MAFEIGPTDALSSPIDTGFLHDSLVSHLTSRFNESDEEDEEEVEEEVLRREKERRAHVRVSESLCECLLFFKVREE